MSLTELYITFLEKNGTLLKVFGQVDQHSAEYLEKLIFHYTDTFERLKVGEPKAARDIYPGLICCARYKDNKYYRAEVRSVVQLTPSYVTVIFIDYGNTERVKLSDLRLLDDIMEPTFSNLHRLASEYYLAGVRPVTNEWDNTTVNFIEEAIRYKTVKCAIVGEVIGKKLVKIFWGESDISSYLISMGVGITFPQEVQEILIETSSGVVPSRYTVPPPPTVPVAPTIRTASVPPMSSYPSLAIRGSSMPLPPYTSSTVAQPTILPPRLGISIPDRPLQTNLNLNIPPPSYVPPQPFSAPVQTKSQQFASEMLPVNSEHVVYVSHVEEGPLSFAVQLKEVAEHALTQLMAELNEHDPFPISRPLLPGSICLGRFSEDQSLCRAVVMHVMNDKCRLYYPDYGNSEVLPCSQIYDMPLQFVEVKVMALRFTLAGFKNVKVTQDMKDIFKDIVTDKELLMKVAPMEENRTKQYCELFLNGHNVRELMKERLAKLTLLEYTKSHVPPRGSIEKVIISYVESPTKIMVQLERNKDTLNTLMSCVAAHCRDTTKNTLKPNQLKKNMPVCAFYPIDTTWYRAQIKEFSETEATVLFVDYGNEDVVPVSSLQRISSDLVIKVRTQALECCLTGFEMSQSDQEIADRLFEIINEKVLTMQVLEIMKNQVLIVALIDEKNVNVVNYLKPASPISQPLHSQFQTALQSPPTTPAVTAAIDEDEWNEGPEPEKHHPLKAGRDFQAGSGRFIIKTQKGPSSNSVQNRLHKIKFQDQRSSYKKAWNDNQSGKRVFNEDSGIKNRRSNSKDDSISQFENNDRFSRNDRKSGRWNRDDDSKNWRSKDDTDNKSSWHNDDSRSPRGKWDRSGDGDGPEESRFNKRWENKDRSNDSGGGRWNRSGDGDDGKFNKFNRDQNRDGDDGGFKKFDRDRNKDNDSGRFNKFNRDGDGGGFNKFNRDGDGGGFNKFNRDGDGGGFNKFNRDGDSGRFNKFDRDRNRDGDGKGFNKSDRDRNRDGNGGGFKKFNRDGDGDGGFNKFNRDGDGGGFKKFNRDDDGGGKFNKVDRDRNNDSSDGGYNKWNRDNKGGRSFGDGPRRFDDKKSFGKSSDDSWDSKPKRDDFGSKFEPRKNSNNRQSSESGGGSTIASPKKVMVPYPEVKLFEKESVEIVFSLSPAECFAQFTKHKDELTELMSTIATNYSTGGTVLESPEKGLYCVAMYSEDEMWYRAIIESASATTASVLFIDYGNNEEVPLEKLKVMTSDIGKLAAQAIKCGLLGVKPKANVAWSDEEQTEFAIAIEGKTLQAEFKNKLFSNDTFQIILRDITEGEDNAVIINSMFNPTEDLEVALSCISTPVDDTFTFKPFPLTVGETVEVQVTWFISPGSFFVQPLHSNAAFREMMEHLQEHVRSFKHVSPFDVKVGRNLIARFKEDKVLYRAEIRETGFLGPLVYFVDYGNNENVDKNQLYEIKPEYSLMPCQAIACSLAGVKPSGENWPALGSSNIEQFFEADVYKCTVLAEGENGFVVSLDTPNGDSVAKQLIDNGFAISDDTSYTVPEQDAYTTVDFSLLINQILNVHVTYVENSAKFFVQLLPAEAKKLQEELDAVTAVLDNLKKIEPDDITENMMCISTVDGLVWQRASVINKSGTSGPILHFIDSGISAEITTDKIYELANDFISIPAQAVECTLAINGMEQSDEEEFKSEVFDKDVFIQVENVDLQRLQVAVYSCEGALIKLLSEKTDKPKEVDPVIPMPVLKKRDRLVISHAETGAIYVQRVADSENIQNLLSDLYEWCEGIAVCEVEWRVGALCCAKSLADDQWYRAKLSEVEPEFNVKYIDYGNSEIVSADRLRKLDMSFFKPEALALQVNIAVNWQVSEEHLLELVPEKEFNAKIIKWLESWYVELLDDSNENLTDKLIELGFATELENSPFLKKVSSLSKLLVGAKVGVCRSHICSASQFWVILNEDFEDLEHLQDRLQNSVAMMKDISGTPPKSMIAAKFSDGIWYRAMYIHAEKAVISVDYGNTEPSSGELKELSEDFLTPDGYAILCSLNVEPIDGTWSEEAIATFDSLIPDDVIVAHILKIDEIVTVDIKVNEESVSKALIDKGFAVKSILTSSVYVSHINSPSDFYVQEENPLLEQIREHLTTSDKFAVIDDVTSYSQNIFATQYHVDGLWYRAKLLSSDENGNLVLFVDYGNSDTSSEFKELPKELLEIPFMAKNCALKLPESMESWSDEACEKFIEFASDGSTLFEIKFFTDDEPALVELSLSGQLVSDLLSTPFDSGLNEELMRVVVSHINSPCDFWIQLENAPLVELANYFVDVENWSVLNVNDMNIDQLVAALLEEDSQWYRAKVLSKPKDGAVDVLFIDYGNSSQSKELRQLPEDLAVLHPAAKHCRMELPYDALEWPTKVIDHFKELTGYGSKVLNMKCLSSDVPSEVKLFIGEEDISNNLLELVPKESIEIVGDEKTDLQKVNISHINSPADFYLQIDKAKVDETMNSMTEGDNFETLSDVICGQLVAARFVDDGQWYRATVTTAEENSFNVFFVDYGNSAAVTELKSLPEHLLDVPYLAQLSCLPMVKESEEWAESAIDKFFELSNDGNTEFGLKILNEGIPMEVELIINGKPVSLLLLESENQDSLCTPDFECDVSDKILDKEISKAGSTSDDLGLSDVSREKQEVNPYELTKKEDNEAAYDNKTVDVMPFEENKGPMDVEKHDGSDNTDVVVCNKIEQDTCIYEFVEDCVETIGESEGVMLDEKCEELDKIEQVRESNKIEIDETDSKKEDNDLDKNYDFGTSKGSKGSITVDKFGEIETVEHSRASNENEQSGACSGEQDTSFAEFNEVKIKTINESEGTKCDDSGERNVKEESDEEEFTKAIHEKENKKDVELVEEASIDDCDRGLETLKKLEKLENEISVFVNNLEAEKSVNMSVHDHKDDIKNESQNVINAEDNSNENQRFENDSESSCLSVNSKANSIVVDENCVITSVQTHNVTEIESDTASNFNFHSNGASSQDVIVDSNEGNDVANSSLNEHVTSTNSGTENQNFLSKTDIDKTCKVPLSDKIVPGPISLGSSLEVSDPESKN